MNKKSEYSFTDKALKFTGSERKKHYKNEFSFTLFCKVKKRADHPKAISHNFLYQLTNVN